MKPTRRQLECFAAFCRLGDGRQAAAEMCIAYPTFKNHVTALYEVLDVHSRIDAARALGWLHVPAEVAA